MMRFKINSEQIKLLIFDCDGTLIDSMRAHYDSWCEIYTTAGKEFSDYTTFMNELAGRSSKNTIKILNEKLGYHLDPETIATHKSKSFIEKYVHKVKPIAKVVQIAQDYYGKIPLVVASGGGAEVVNASLRVAGIHELFAKIITAEDVTRCKPSPDIFLAAAEQVNITNYCECLVFEDAMIGIQAAQAAGMQYVDINTLAEDPIDTKIWSWR